MNAAANQMIDRCWTDEDLCELVGATSDDTQPEPQSQAAVAFNDKRPAWRPLLITSAAYMI